MALNAALSGREPAVSVAAGPNEPHISLALGAFLFALFIAGAVGLGLAIAFLSSQGRFRSARRPRIQPQVLLMSFLVFPVSNLVLGGSIGLAILLLGFSLDTNIGAAVHMAGQILAMLGAFALGWSSLQWLTSYTLEDVREIGWRVGALGRAAAWGVGGYCAAIPFMVAGLVISQRLSHVFFRHVPTPEHPIVPVLLKGDAAFAAAMVLAVVVAPIVEETFFRGMLYNALRGVMGVWVASLVSGAIFAIIHPTMPAGFLPIFALGVVLAILRERTGSLVPSMVCHGINNAVALTLVRLIY